MRRSGDQILRQGSALFSLAALGLAHTSLSAIAKTYGRAIGDTYLAGNLASGYTPRLALVGQSRSRQPGLETTRHRAFMKLGICLWEHYLA
ncbi:uncharacterized protein PpBr36_11466 [Pyricularia pennisetigena]|uniref:uncharacterized protein n=1 Tax=Pyricularia pennisetigena TaxID=1578925 RepID=UPI00115025C1|nr:uncharacterized protein PpBr36_11466 [Pyricularia pennisetigena]TLS20278.1 hypothetical protein PpBr36_11466 [Pyricularia pennisetigena]